MRLYKEIVAEDACMLRANDGDFLLYDADNCVVGDIIKLTPSVRVPADCEIIDFIESPVSAEELHVTGNREGVKLRMGDTALAGSTIIEGSFVVSDVLFFLFSCPSTLIHKILSSMISNPMIFRPSLY